MPQKIKGHERKKDMKRAVIYERYSSDKWRKESIEEQLRECTEFAKK